MPRATQNLQEWECLQEAPGLHHLACLSCFPFLSGSYFVKDECEQVFVILLCNVFASLTKIFREKLLINYSVCHVDECSGLCPFFPLAWCFFFIRIHSSLSIWNVFSHIVGIFLYAIKFHSPIWPLWLYYFCSRSMLRKVPLTPRLH